MNTTMISSAKQNLEDLIEQVENDAEPILIMLDENRKAVLMSESEFNSWQETIYLLSKSNLNLIVIHFQLDPLVRNQPH